MYFADLQATLVTTLRDRVRNGELTERSLARLAGVSQPHMHNVLKGVRVLSPELCDQVLQRLRISVLDLINREHLFQYLETVQAGGSQFPYLPLLQGRLGPGCGWPVGVERHERFPVSMAVVAKMRQPVAARLAEDVRMAPLFSEGDLALLDQSQRARMEITRGQLYLIKKGENGYIRHLRQVGTAIYAVTEDCLNHPEGWERLPMESSLLQHFVRARVTLITSEIEWNRAAETTQPGKDRTISDR